MARNSPGTGGNVARLRKRLTAWYVGTLALTLMILGTALYLTISEQLSRRIRRTLRQRVASVERAARVIDSATNAPETVTARLRELRFTDRDVFLLTPTGVPIAPPSAPPWVRSVAKRAVNGGTYTAERAPDGRGRLEGLRVWGERFVVGDTVALVALAASEPAELEDQYAGLIVAFGGAAALALILISAGGWFLVRKSTAPIERTIVQMREFMSDAAHELRTPVTVIRTGAEVATQQPRDPEQYVTALTGIAAESGRLSAILDDLLILARADAGARQVERRPLFLDDVAADAAQAARPMAEAAGVALVVEQFDEVEITGDRTLVRQLVMILLDNAIKYTAPTGTVSLHVGRNVGAPSVIITDTGIGIPANDLPRIFERFFRVDRSRSLGAAPGRSAGGAGLGLAIARWIADAHGAAITVTSTVGEGTTVAVRFPEASP
ncbi:MAG: sensor histidine kinase [Gemmatimonadales bacterium]